MDAMGVVMRWFLDTEFHENGRIIDLISIALVPEKTGEPYYAVSTEWEPEICNQFVRDHVISKLPPLETWKSRSLIAEEVQGLLLAEGKPQIWGYFADYDWVALCQLYGPMINLPKGFPHWCRDLKQLMKGLGMNKEDLPPQEPAMAHTAIGDAMWIRDSFLAIAPRIARPW